MLAAHSQAMAVVMEALVNLLAAAALVVTLVMAEQAEIPMDLQAQVVVVAAVVQELEMVMLAAAAAV
jgi:hypothetical protein